MRNRPSSGHISDPLGQGGHHGSPDGQPPATRGGRSARWFTFAEARAELQGLSAVVLDTDVEASGRVFVSLAQVGMKVRLARRVALGMALIEETRPQLVLLSTQLPDGESLPLVARLRALPEPPRVVAICPGASRNERRRFLAAGCKAFLAKPIDLHLFAQDLAYELAGPRVLPSTAAHGRSRQV